MTIPDTSEASLWERARAGDPDAFGSIFDLHEARIFRQARRLTDSYDDAEDVTALVFLEAWRRREAVRLVDGSVVAWLAVTTTNVARNSTRSRNRHRALLAKLHDTAGTAAGIAAGTAAGSTACSAAGDAAGRAAFSSAVVPDHAPGIDDRLDRAALAATARSALARLPRRDQDVIALCILQGLSTQEASEALDIPPGTVKSRLSRARSRLSAEVLGTLGGPLPASPSPSTHNALPGGAR